MLGFLALAVANAAAVLGAHALTRRLATGKPELDVMIFLLIRLALISGVVLLAGTLSTLRSLPLGLAGAAALAALLAFGEHRRLPRLRIPRAARWAAAFALFLAARLLLQVWFFAPVHGDALDYHLPKVAEWIQQGRFTADPGPDPRCAFPAGFELVEAWWAVFLHHDVLIEMAGVEFLALGFAAAAALGRWAGLDRPAACLAGFLFALTPGLALQATACLNDAPAAVLIVATAALLVERVHLGLAILAAGMGLGVKPTYGFALPALALLAFLVRREPRLPCPSPRAAIVLLAVGTVLGAAWYGRNAIVYGNPIHPMNREGHRSADGVIKQQLGPRFESLRRNLAALANSGISDAGFAYTPLLFKISGWGPAAFSCGILALLLGLREDPRIRRLGAAFGAALLSVLALALPDPWVLRFVLFFPALLAVAAARLAASSREFYAFLWICLVIQFAGTCVTGGDSMGEVRDLAAQDWRSRSASPLLAGQGPRDAIGCMAGGARRVYTMYRPDFSRRVVILRAASAEELMAALEREKLDVVYSQPKTAAIQEAVRRGWLRPEPAYLFVRKRP